MDASWDKTAGDALSAQLDAHLAACARQDSWRVERVLRDTPFEVTEVVYFQGAGGGELGPFIRRRLDCSAGVGFAYDAIRSAQERGIRLVHVPQVIDMVRAGDKLQVVLEYVEGPTLETYVADEGPGLELAARLFPALCEAVAELHESLDPPLIHRDLKPSNIIMRAGVPVIIDYGIARSWREGAQSDTAHFGTRSYAPPEQFGFGQTDERTDVYALGKLLYYCMTGDDPPNILDARACAERGFPSAVAEVIGRACAFDPDARYASAAALGEAFCSLDAAPAPRLRLGDWAGRVWNGALFAALSFIVIVSIIAIAVPNEADRAFPLWFRILEYVGICMVSPGAICFLLMDRRRLNERFPVLAACGRWRILGLCALVFALGIAIPTVAGMAAGLV